MDQQYDVSDEMKKLFEIKNKQRTEAKEYFQKLLLNPYRPINDGVIHDPANTRFNSLFYYRYQLYPTTPRFVFKAFVILSPILMISCGVIYTKKIKEEKLRSGTIKYKDRASQLYF